MSKRAKRWAVVVVLLLALPPAGLTLAALLIDPNAYKPRIAAVVAEQTGRVLSIDGPIRIGWSLRPKITISDVRLSNLSGGSRPDMARVERIEAKLSLLALLHRRVVVTMLTLVGPNILFEPVDGRPNWIFRRQNAGQAPVILPASSPASGKAPFKIDATHVQNGMVTFHFPNRTNVIGLRSLDYAHDVWTDPLRLDAVLVYRDFKPFTFHATSVPTGGTLDPWTTRLDASAFGATLRAHGETSLDGPLDLDLSLTAPALEQLNQILPSLHLPPLHGLSLTTHLSSTGPDVLPIPGRTSLTVASADLGDRLPGLSLRDLRLELPHVDGIVTVTSAGRYRSQPFTLSASANMPRRFDGRTTEPVTVTVKPVSQESVKAAGDRPGGDALSLRGTLALDDGGFDGFDGSLSLRAASLAAFRPISSPSLPALTNLSLDTEIALPAPRNRVTLRHLSLRAAEGDLDGDASWRMGGARDATATLHSSRLQLDVMLPARTEKRDTPFMTTPLPWGSLQGVGLDLDWRAEHVIYRGQDWPDLRLHAVLDGGTLTVDLPGGLLSGHAVIAAGARPTAVPVSLALRTDAFPLQPLAGLAGLPSPANDPVRGVLRMALDLSAHGDTPQALAASLKGRFALATSDASMSQSALSSLAGPALKQLGARPAPDDHVTVRCFGLRGTATDGVLKLSSIAVNAGSLVLSGVGTVDLANDTLALKLHPLARLVGSRVSVPVMVQGKLSAPRATLEASGFDKVGLLLDALFGGDHPRPCAEAGLALN